MGGGGAVGGGGVFLSADGGGAALAGDAGACAGGGAAALAWHDLVQRLHLAPVGVPPGRAGLAAAAGRHSAGRGIVLRDRASLPGGTTRGEGRLRCRAARRRCAAGGDGEPGGMRNLLIAPSHRLPQRATDERSERWLRSQTMVLASARCDSGAGGTCQPADECPVPRGLNALHAKWTSPAASRQGVESPATRPDEEPKREISNERG